MTLSRPISILALLFVTVIILLYSGMYTTSNVVERTKPPPRPDSVPETAVWCRHPAGQVWIDCVAVESEENRFSITLYSQPSGVIDFGGEYFIPDLLSSSIRASINGEMAAGRSMTGFSPFRKRSISSR